MKDKVIHKIYRMIFQCKNEKHIRTIENYILQAYKQNVISQDEYNTLIELLYDSYKESISNIDRLYTNHKGNHNQ
jgi:hypothetical protein